MIEQNRALGAMEDGAKTIDIDNKGVKLSTYRSLDVFRYVLDEAGVWLYTSLIENDELLISLGSDRFDREVAARVEIYSMLAACHEYWPDLMLAVGADDFREFLSLIKDFPEPILAPSSKIYIDMMLNDTAVIVAHQRVSRSSVGHRH